MHGEVCSLAYRSFPCPAFHLSAVTCSAVRVINLNTTRSTENRSTSFRIDAKRPLYAARLYAAASVLCPIDPGEGPSFSSKEWYRSPVHCGKQCKGRHHRL